MNLIQLIAKHKGDRTYEDLERACGKAVTSQRLQQMGTKPPKAFPSTVAVKALSSILGVSELAVVLAAAESLGLEVSSNESRLAQIMPASLSKLSEDETAAIAHVIRAFKGEEVTGNVEGDPAPTKSPESGPAHDDPDNVIDLPLADDEPLAANDTDEQQQEPGEGPDHET